jgi:polyisoprenoid-binding protein YceI
MANTKWVLDPTHSELGFKIRHLMITNVSGFFNSFQVEGETRGEDFSTAKIQLRADMNSIHTNNEQRDGHLKNADFFETDKYPEMVFESTRIEKTEGGNFRLYGNLSLKNISRPVQLDVEYSGTTNDPWGGERAGFTVTGKIKRSDWGISFGLLDAGSTMLADEVKIHSEIQMVKQAVTDEKKEKELVG